MVSTGRYSNSRRKRCILQNIILPRLLLSALFFFDQGQKSNKKGSEVLPVPNPAPANSSTETTN